MRTWILTDAYFIDWSERSPTEQVRMRPFVMMGVIVCHRYARTEMARGSPPRASDARLPYNYEKNQSRKLKSVMVSEQTDQNFVIFCLFFSFPRIHSFYKGRLMNVTAAQTDPCLPFLPYGIKYEIFDTHVSLNYIK